MTKRILIAEDERNIAESLRFLLTRAGHEVQLAIDGDEALTMLRRDPPDALVLDLMLPKRSGFDILKELRAHDSTRTLPVLMLTAKGQANDRQTAEGLGVDAFVTKPFANDDVIENRQTLAERAGRMSKRASRARDLATIVPFAGIALLMPPLIGLFAQGQTTVAGMPLIVVYLFGLWFALIIAALLLARHLITHDEGGDS